MNNPDGLHSPYGAFEMPDNTLGHIAHNGIGLPIDRTVIPEPIKSDASLLDRLAAFATWIGEFPFQQACVQGERVVNEAIAEIERLRGEIADGDASELTSLRSDAERVGEMEAKVRELGEDNFAARMYASNMERCSKESDARVQELERQLGIAVGALESMAGPVHCGCEPCTGCQEV